MQLARASRRASLRRVLPDVVALARRNTAHLSPPAGMQGGFDGGFLVVTEVVPAEVKPL